MKAPPKSSWLRASSGSIGIAVNFGGRKISALCSGPMPAPSSRSPTARRGRGRGDQQPGLVRGAGAAEVLELELPVVVARDGEQCVEVAVPDRLGRLVMVVRPRDPRPIVAVRRLGGRVGLGVGGEDERCLDRDDRVGAEPLGLDVHRDRRRIGDVEGGQDGGNHRHRHDRDGQQQRRDEERASSDADQVLATGDVQRVREQVAHVDAPRPVAARCSSDSSTARCPTCSMKISSRLGSAISKRVTRSPRSIAARSTVSGSRSAGT